MLYFEWVINFPLLHLLLHLFDGFVVEVVLFLLSRLKVVLSLISLGLPPPLALTFIVVFHFLIILQYFY